MHAQAFREIALSFDDVEEVAHFDKQAFRARRIFATLAPDGSANILLAPEEQDVLTAQHPEILAPVANKWGDRGWTRLSLAHADPDTVQHLLALAWKGSS